MWRSLSVFEKLFSPHFCLHCHALLNHQALLFCKGCAGFFELIDAQVCCPYCFKECGRNTPCGNCVKKKAYKVRCSAALDGFDPVKSLVLLIKKGHYPFLAKTAAAFMTCQFYRLGWPKPDWIVPIPPRHFFGVDPVFMIAKEIAKNLQVNILKCLGRKMGDLPANRLGKDIMEKTRNFYLKKPQMIEGKKLLCIDDEMITGETFKKAGETLSQGFPKGLYAVSLARSVEGDSSSDSKEIVTYPFI